MFKSKFANALTTMMIGSLGIAAAENKVSIGYGAEAGEMDPHAGAAVRALLQPIADPHAQRGLASGFERAGRAQRTGHRHGVDVRAARPGSRAPGARREAGWDGRAPVLAVCPIHPFWWPVKASVGKFLANAAFGAYRDEPLPLGLLSHRGSGGGRGLCTLHFGHGARRGSLSPAARRLCDSGGDGAARRARLRSPGGAAGPAADFHLGPATTCTSW